MQLDSICGNARLKSQLGQAFDSGRLAQTLLISGPAYSGKKTIARLCAAALLCRTTGIGARSLALKPCLRCAACRRVMADMHPDVSMFDRGSESVKVDDVRSLIESASESAIEGGARVFIVCHAENLNVNAQNAFLKSLEEPFGQLYFILLSENKDLLLPTVRSRCMHFSTEPVPEYETVEWLYSHCPDRTEEEILEAARLSQGCVGQAERLLNEDTDEAAGAEMAAEVLEALQKDDELELWKVLQSKEKLKREFLFSFFHTLRTYARDGLMVRYGRTEAVYTRYGNVASTISKERLIRIADLCGEYMELCGKNVGPVNIIGAFCPAFYS